MWDRKELKNKAKGRLHVNYWRMVLVAAIIMALTGGAIGFTYSFDYSDVKSIFKGEYSEKVDEWIDDAREDLDDIIPFEKNGDYDDNVETAVALVLPIAVVALAIVAVIAAFGTAISIFIKNPLYVGCQGFFADNSEENGKLSKIVTAFRSNYVQITLGMFLRDLFTTLWTLLFIIPGIIKSYEYRMIPYILADNPGIRQRDAFEISRRMMDGNKWRAFVLDLSFIGWELLNGLTLGILGIFYVNPYRLQTEAELYSELKRINDNGSAPVMTQEYENYAEI